jgi:Spy/CpxP family protein refolding chaperone
MKRSVLTIVMLAVMLFVLCAAANAAERIPSGIFKGLNLSADQEKQMRTLFERQRGDEKKKFEKIRGLQENLDEEFLKDRPDESKIKSTVNTIKNIQTELLDEHFDNLLALRKVLTPEQFRKFIEKGKKMREKNGGYFKGFWQTRHPTREGSTRPKE